MKKIVFLLLLGGSAPFAFAKQAIIVLAKKASSPAMSIVRVHEQTVRIGHKDFDAHNVDESLFGHVEESRCARLAPNPERRGVYEVTYSGQEKVEDIHFSLEVVDHDLEVVRVLVVSEDELARFTMLRSGVLTLDEDDDFDDPFGDEAMFDLEELSDAMQDHVPAPTNVTYWQQAKVLCFVTYFALQNVASAARSLIYKHIISE